jgi:hypothetical protein
MRLVATDLPIARLSLQIQQDRFLNPLMGREEDLNHEQLPARMRGEASGYLTLPRITISLWHLPVF